MKSRTGINFIFITILIVANSVSILAQEQIVQTQFGAVQGVISSTARSFLGIPFATIPQRWSASVLWSGPLMTGGGTFAATSFGPACPQIGGPTFQSEQCLSLNVFTPRAAQITTPLPVMVFIYGGSFIGGSTAQPAYQAQNLASLQNVIVVVLNYRLGPFGFLYIPQLATQSAGSAAGNYGLLDQQLGLRWTQQNIAAFGGDPNRVAVFGESAGAVSVCMHTVMPSSFGLFSAAISESGSYAQVFTVQQASQIGASFVNAVGCTGASDVLACIRAVDTTAVLGALSTSGTAYLNLIWSPVYGASLMIPALPNALIASGQTAGVPMILGTNTDEMSVWVYGYQSPAAAVDAASYVQIVGQFARGNTTLAALLVQQNPPNATVGADNRPLLTALESQYAFICPSHYAAAALNAAGVPVYVYRFNYLSACTFVGAQFGVYHTAEIPFVFDTNLAPSMSCNFSSTDQQVAVTMGAYWASMAATGNPNSAQAQYARPTWPIYQAGGQNIVLQSPVSIESGYDAQQCAQWKGVVGVPVITASPAVSRGVVAGIVIGCVGALLLLCVAVCCVRRRNAAAQSGGGGRELGQQLL